MSDSGQGSNKVIMWIAIIAGVGVVGLCVLGVLAAIAIPAFVKYLKKSKASEATAVTKRISDEVVAGYTESCSLPPSLPRHADPSECCGGQKCRPDQQASQAWTSAGIEPPSDPTYFAYSTEHKSDGTYEVVAVADFTCGGEMHTVTVMIDPQKDGSSCTASASPAVTTNEFE